MVPLRCGSTYEESRHARRTTTLGTPDRGDRGRGADRGEFRRRRQPRPGRRRRAFNYAEALQKSLFFYEAQVVRPASRPGTGSPGAATPP